MGPKQYRRQSIVGEGQRKQNIADFGPSGATQYLFQKKSLEALSRDTGS